VKAQAAERENWNCDKCRTEKVRMLQEELQNARRQIDELKARNRELEAKLQMAGTGESDAMPTKKGYSRFTTKQMSQACKFSSAINLHFGQATAETWRRYGTISKI
jgi:predicted RNase H-like nuclease (RuvC/YqgF family)